MAHLAPCLWHITKTYLLHLQALIYLPSRALLYWDQNGRKGETLDPESESLWQISSRGRGGVAPYPLIPPGRVFHVWIATVTQALGDLAHLGGIP